MKLFFSFILVFLSLQAYEIKNPDGDVIFYIGGDNNDRVSINCGENIDEDYAVKICGKILVDDIVLNKPTLNIETSKSIDETSGDQTLSVTVSLSEATADDVTFDLKTADGSGDGGALADEDYTAIDDSYTINAGDTSITIDITIKGDDTYEYDDIFTAKISNPSDNAVVGDSTCVIQINNDDTKPTVKVKDDVSASEADDPSFTVELSSASGVPTTVHILMSNDTTEDADFEGDSPIDADYVIAKGDSSKDITVDVNDDGDDEDDETYYFKITDSDNADIDTDNDEKQGTIEDDDSSGYFSDRRLKTDVREIQHPLEDINKIRGVKFYWKDKKRFTTRENIGVIAQEVEKVYPQVIVTTKDGYKKVKYQFLVAPLIEAVKELKRENEELRKRVEQLEKAKK